MISAAGPDAGIAPLDGTALAVLVGSVALVVVLWVAVALLVGMLLGRVVRRRDQQRPADDQPDTALRDRGQP